MGLQPTHLGLCLKDKNMVLFLSEKSASEMLCTVCTCRGGRRAGSTQSVHLQRASSPSMTT